MAVPSERSSTGVPPRVIFVIVFSSVWVLGIIMYAIFYYLQRKRAARRARHEADAEAAQMRGIPYGGPASPFGSPYGGPPVARGTVVAFQEVPVAVAGSTNVSPSNPEGAPHTVAWPAPAQLPPLYPGVVMEQRQQPGNTTDSAIVYGTSSYYVRPDAPQTEDTVHVKPQ
ncbi:hypothetical protein JIQ42_02797 [Leishmania sp. Namibia]|uniref:hypothetical protein n=1 Tax=Leishmania sp. Namibia TaxID=2802991 RepID=UPI001B44632B|nr:hypothetical protein JIQ42_02797 [Leishmania sp. Namibia]